MAGPRNMRIITPLGAPGAIACDLGRSHSAVSLGQFSVQDNRRSGAGHFMKRVLASFAVLTSLAGLALADTYGAIAYSPSTRAIGWSYAYAATPKPLPGAIATAAPTIVASQSGSETVAARWPSAIAAAGAPAGVMMAARPSARRSAVAESKPAAAASSAGNVRRTNKPGWVAAKPSHH